MDMIILLSLPSNASKAPCILCDVKINLKERNHACVGLKGLETINNFPVKHNELHPEKKLPIFEFDGSKRYVHTDCRNSPVAKPHILTIPCTSVHTMFFRILL